MLPIGVLLPTFQSRTRLEAHVASLRAWSDRVEEIVVVDSHSNDGTLEFLKSRLDASRARFFSHPPGLYESWNFGLCQIRARYTYIATVGDSIDVEGLNALFEVAEATSADAVISPPRFIDARGRDLDKQWPVHRFLLRHPTALPLMISPSQFFGWAVAYLPDTLLGSSASNLYRTGYFQSHPFPLGFGHAGDTAWALTNAFTARLAILPIARSVFQVHEALTPTSDEDYQDLMVKLVRLANEVLETHVAGRSDAPPAPPMSALMRDLLVDFDFKNHYRQAYRDCRLPWCPWFLQPAARKLRSKRKIVQSHIRSVREQLLTNLAPRQT